MNTITINSRAALVLAAAAERARSEKPLVRKTLDYGVYVVLSSDKTKEYKVTCNSESRTITCTCPARKPCKHIAAVAPIHSWIARQLRDQAALALAVAEAEAANWPVPVEQSEVPSFDAEVAQVAAPVVADDLYADLIPSFDDQVAEIRSICSDTTAQLTAYTAEMAAKDTADLFG